MSATHDQASAISVMLLLGVGIVAISFLTASVGGLVDVQTAGVDADAAADGFSLFRDGAVTAANDGYPVRITDGDPS